MKQLLRINLWGLKINRKLDQWNKQLICGKLIKNYYIQWLLKDTEQMTSANTFYEESNYTKIRSWQ